MVIALVEISFPIFPSLLINTKIYYNSILYSASSHLLGISGKGENSAIDVSSFQIELSALDKVHCIYRFKQCNK